MRSIGQKISDSGMTYKDVCGKEPCIWFEIGTRARDRTAFFKWAKALGCVWLNGEEIKPHSGYGAPYISMHSNGELANVGMWSWVAYWRKKEENRTKVVSVEEFGEFVADIINKKRDEK